jgi:hypothetical protein
MQGSETDQNHAALRLRALAHPLRWKLLDLIVREGTATATRCSEVTRESVASCSYHLNILGKYGYLEAVRGTGKDKPWRSTSLHQDLAAPSLDIEDQLASEAATEAFLEHEFARARASRRQLGTEPGEWQRASGLGGATIWVSAEELDHITKELTGILRRYAQRSEDASLRPAGARESRVFFYTAASPE